MRLILALFLIFLCQITFGQKVSEIIFPPPVLGMDVPEFMSACKLFDHKNELVYTRFIYSGVDEYWGLNPDKKCINLNAYLDIPDNVEIREDYKNQFKDVYDHYWNKYLIIDLIGTLSDESSSGYGHLGSNKYRFTVKYIIGIYTYSKK